MIISTFRREAILKLLPRNMTGAEIGVANGDFSQEIIASISPSKLYLVDPWEFSDDKEYLPDPNNVDNIQNEKRYLSVRERFRNEINNGNVKIIRATSASAVMEIEPESLDFVYIDGCHTYDAVSHDLDEWGKRVGKDGIILGHDYANHEIALNNNFGVVEAVNDYCDRTGLEIFCITKEAYPTFVIFKNKNSDRAKQIIAKLLYHEFCSIDIENSQIRKMKQQYISFSNNEAGVIIHF